MCVLAFAWRADERWPLILIGNRDEHHARPTAPLAKWEDGEIIAGRDLQSGGTWLGVSETGRLAVVTNVATGRPPTGLSRGTIVTDFLRGRMSFDDDEAYDAFNAFNLIAVDGLGAHFLSNSPAPHRRRLDAGVYAIANGPLNEHLYRTDTLSAALVDWLAGDSERPQDLLGLLANDSTGSDSRPGGRGEPSGTGEPAVPILIRHPVYGTRCSTVVAVDARGSGLIVERRYRPDGRASGQSSMGFRWPAILAR